MKVRSKLFPLPLLDDRSVYLFKSMCCTGRTKCYSIIAVKMPAEIASLLKMFKTWVPAVIKWRAKELLNVAREAEFSIWRRKKLVLFWRGSGRKCEWRAKDRCNNVSKSSSIQIKKDFRILLVWLRETEFVGIGYDSSLIPHFHWELIG